MSSPDETRPGAPACDGVTPLDPEGTWHAATAGATCVWWQLTTFVDVAGEDAVRFLDSISTQAIADIAGGCARHALLLTPKARIVAPLVVYRGDGDRLLLELEPHLVADAVAHMSRYRLRARCTIEPVDLGAVSVVGPDSARFDGEPGWYASPLFGVPARTFVGPREVAAALVNDTLPAAGIRLADPEAIDALRIVHGIPLLNDMPPGHMPAEVGAMDVAVSLTKGCYTGQEPVARLHYRGHPNRTLRQLRLSALVPEDEAAVATAAADATGDDGVVGTDPLLELRDGERVVGAVTSWATLPGGEVVALGIVRREMEDGAELSLAGGAVTAVPGDLRTLIPLAPVD